jgi:hypothetical protein
MCACVRACMRVRSDRDIDRETRAHSGAHRHRHIQTFSEKDKKTDAHLSSMAVMRGSEASTPGRHIGVSICTFVLVKPVNLGFTWQLFQDIFDEIRILKEQKALCYVRFELIL